MNNEKTLKRILSCLIAFWIAFGSFIWVAAVSTIPLYPQLSKEWMMVVSLVLVYSCFFGWFITIATKAITKELSI